MNLLALLFLALAAFCFALDATGWVARSLVSLGLALLTVGLIVQFTATDRPITF